MRKLILTIFVGLSYMLSYACSCYGPRTFCEAAISYDRVPTFILQVVKLSDTLHGMDVAVLQSYVGQPKSDTIRVWGDPGHLCREYTGRWAMGDTLMLNLTQLDTSYFFQDEQAGDFEISHCGLHYLSIRQGMVMGKIGLNREIMPIDTFTDFIDHLLQENSCLLVNHRDIVLESEVKILPNPAQNYLSIKSSNQIEIVTISSLGGEALISCQDCINQLPISNLPAGIYFIKVQIRNGGWISSKFVKL